MEAATYGRGMQARPQTSTLHVSVAVVICLVRRERRKGRWARWCRQRPGTGSLGPSVLYLAHCKTLYGPSFLYLGQSHGQLQTTCIHHHPYSIEGGRAFQLHTPSGTTSPAQAFRSHELQSGGCETLQSPIGHFCNVDSPKSDARLHVFSSITSSEVTV
jgi:hypothetical protein